MMIDKNQELPVRPASGGFSALRRTLAKIILGIFIVNNFLAAPAAYAQIARGEAGGTKKSSLALTPPLPLTTLGTAVTENFNTLGASGTSGTTPAGWGFAETGANANATYTAGTGSSNTGDTYSFGTTAADRALGGLRSGNLIPFIGAAYINNTGGTINSLAIAYTGEQWRLGTANRGADRLDFQYSLNATSLTTGTWTDVDALDFESPSTTGTVGLRDGNAAANRTALSSTIANLSIPNGATFFIRWSDVDVSGADDALAVDDFSLTPSGTTTSPTNPSGVGAASPATVTAGGQTLLTMTVTPGTNPASTGLAVRGDLSSIGGSATQAFFDDGTNGDATAGDNVFSYLATVAAGTAAGVKNLPLTVTDAQTRTGTASLALTVTGSTGGNVPAVPFQQNWSNTGLITVNNDWSSVPGIVGYRGDNLTGAIATDPQTILADGADTPVNVTANQTDPNTLISGGIYEFELADPVVAFQGSGTASAPHLVVSVDTTGQSNITVSYNLRDIDGSTDNAIQPVALQYRVGNAGNYTNVPAAFVADASSGPSEATLVTPVNVALPVAVNNQPLVQLRIITSNALGNDEFIGIDDISVLSGGVIPLSASGSASPSQVQRGNPTLLRVTVNPATNPASTGIAVTGDLTAIGGSAVQQFYDDGTNGDTTAGDNVFSYNATVDLATAPGAKSLPVAVTDAQNRSVNTTIGLTVTTPGGGEPHTPEEHLVLGNPSNAVMDVNQPFNYLLPRNQYVMSYHRDRAIPNWVAWHLDSSWIGGASRQDDYRADTSLPAGWYQVQSNSYSGSGFDRGHMTPSADRTSSIPDNSATFLMTNFIPQAPGNNQGPWERHESYLRTVVGQGNEIYIVAGGYGQGGNGDGGFATTVDGGRVTVPAYTWKVALVLPTGDNDVARIDQNTRAFAVIMPNDTAIRPDAWQKYLATVDQVEALTGYDFFSNVPPAIQDVIESRLDTISNTSPQTVAGGTYTNLSVAATPNVTLTGNVQVNGTLDLGPSTIRTGNFKITVAPNAVINRISGHVDGTIEKQFNSAAAPNFVFPVGNARGYSPVTADLTALGANPSSLAVRAVAGAHPNVPDPNQALQRYWTLTENGDLTANITFNYLQKDVPASANENDFRLQRYAGAFSQVTAAVDINANTATANGISQFSDWTLFAVAPTTAAVTIEGRAIDASGRGVPNVIVSLMDPQGTVRTTRTNSFGRYEFTDIRAGFLYTLSGNSRNLQFTPRTVQADENLSGIDLTADGNL